MEKLNENLQKQYKEHSSEDLQNIMKNLEINEGNQNNTKVQQPYNQGMNTNRCVIRNIKGMKKVHIPWLNKERAEAVARRRLSLRNIKKCFVWGEEL